MSHAGTPPPPPPNPNSDSKADRAAQKAYAKAQRPWFKKKRWWAVGFVALLIIAAAAGGGGTGSGGGMDTGPKEEKSVAGNAVENDAAADSDKAEASNPDEGVFEITVTSTGSSSANSITFMQPGGNFEMSQENGKPLPWTKRWTDVDSVGMGWNMNAQQNGSGDIKCVVKHNGKVIAENTSSGSYAMVTCTP